MRSGMARNFPQRVAALSVPEPLSAAMLPLLAVMETLNLQIAAADARLARHAAHDPVVRRLETVPSIGPVTALGFVATLDRVERFRGPHPAAAYLGLVPGERSSGEQQHRGPITKRGNSRTRWLLIEAAWGMFPTPIPTPRNCAPGPPASPPRVSPIPPASTQIAAPRRRRSPAWGASRTPTRHLHPHSRLAIVPPARTRPATRPDSARSIRLGGRSATVARAAPSYVTPAPPRHWPTVRRAHRPGAARGGRGCGAPPAAR